MTARGFALIFGILYLGVGLLGLMPGMLRAPLEDALAVHNRYTVDWAKLTSELLTKRPGRVDPMYFMRSAWLRAASWSCPWWRPARRCRS